MRSSPPWTLFLLLTSVRALQVYKCRDGWTLRGPGTDKCWKTIATKNDLSAASAACREEDSRLALLSSVSDAFHARRRLDQICSGTGKRACSTLCFQNEFGPMMSYYHRMPWHVEELRNNNTYLQFERPLQTNDYLFFFFVSSEKRQNLLTYGNPPFACSLCINIDRQEADSFIYLRTKIVEENLDDNDENEGSTILESLKLLPRTSDDVYEILWAFRKSPNVRGHNITVYGGSLGDEVVDFGGYHNFPSQMSVENGEDAAVDAHVVHIDKPMHVNKFPTIICNWGQNAGVVRIPEFKIRNYTFALCETKATLVEVATPKFFDFLRTRGNLKVILIATAPVVVATFDVFFMLFRRT